MADTHDTMKKAVELTVLILLALIFLAISLSAILGNAGYLIAAAALLIIFIIIFRIKQKRNILTALILVILAADVSIPCLLVIGSGTRALTSREEKAVLNYLEHKYGGHGFRLISAQAQNEQLTGLENMFRYMAFDWSEIEVSAADEGGHVFAVQGYKKPFFGNIAVLYDDYGVLSAAYKHTGLFHDRVTDIRTTLWGICRPENGGRQTSYNDNDYSVNLFMEIDYSGQSVEEFDVNTEHLNMEILKQAVLDQSGCKNTYVYGDYMTDNGEIMYFRDYFLYPETTD